MFTSNATQILVSTFYLKNNFKYIFTGAIVTCALMSLSGEQVWVSMDGK